jgi:ubiquinone/menaquinone biosynthesis C-methylase UbiE
LVSIRQTSTKYRGRKAETYDAMRQKQVRWKIENETVERMLREIRPHSVLDCPIGTGRFLRLYADLSVREVIGVDSSDEMLRLARRKVPRSMKQHAKVRLEVGDARKHDCVDQRVHCVVCVRFLDLIEEEAMHAVMQEMMRVADKLIVLTIRFGPKYVPKSNTATHDSKKFLSLVRHSKWIVVERVPVLNAGWEIVRLGR